MQIGGIQVGAHGNCQRHGFTARRIPCGIDPVFIHGKVLNKVLCQLNGLSCGLLTPVGKLS